MRISIGKSYDVDVFDSANNLVTTVYGITGCTSIQQVIKQAASKTYVQVAYVAIYSCEDMTKKEKYSIVGRKLK